MMELKIRTSDVCQLHNALHTACNHFGILVQSFRVLRYNDHRKGICATMHGSCRYWKPCRGQSTPAVTTLTSLCATVAAAAAQVHPRSVMMLLFWSYSAGALTPRFWQRWRTGHCLRMCPLTWRPFALTPGSLLTGILSSCTLFCTDQGLAISRLHRWYVPVCCAGTS